MFYPANINMFNCLAVLDKDFYFTTLHTFETVVRTESVVNPISEVCSFQKSATGLFLIYSALRNLPVYTFLWIASDSYPCAHFLHVSLNSLALQDSCEVFRIFRSQNTDVFPSQRVTKLSTVSN